MLGAQVLLCAQVVTTADAVFAFSDPPQDLSDTRHGTLAAELDRASADLGSQLQFVEVVPGQGATPRPRFGIVPIDKLREVGAVYFSSSWTTFNPSQATS